MSCPAIYDNQSEEYVIDFQWRVPFSPAILDHINVSVITASRLRKLNDNFDDPSPIQLGLLFDTVPVHVS